MTSPRFLLARLLLFATAAVARVDYEFFSDAEGSVSYAGEEGTVGKEGAA